MGCSVSSLRFRKTHASHVDHNLAKLVDSLLPERGEVKTLTESEKIHILDSSDRDSHLWTLALYGLLRGGISGLRWDSSDFEKQTIDFLRDRVAVNLEIHADTSNPASNRRELPMPQGKVVDILKDAH